MSQATMLKKKYELVHGDTKLTASGKRLTRIRALISITCPSPQRSSTLKRLGEIKPDQLGSDATMDVMPGDLGGYIETEKNLSQRGSSWVAHEACAFDDAHIYGNAWLSDNACASDRCQIFDNAHLFGFAQARGHALVYGSARVFDNAQVTEQAQAYDFAQISGNAWLHGRAWVFANARICQEAQVGGHALVGQDALVTDTSNEGTASGAVSRGYWSYTSIWGHLASKFKPKNGLHQAVQDVEYRESSAEKPRRFSLFALRLIDI
jgi:acetyltransferase-like isoleucine patch superfamily enzyme